jgi:hypothetical protein
MAALTLATAAVHLVAAFAEPPPRLAPGPLPSDASVV